jgi:hypothetical protein
LLFVCGTIFGLILTRAISRDDIKFLKRALSVRENARYIRDEIGGEIPGKERDE